MQSKIFISYRRDDTEGYAGRLYDRLTGVFGKKRVFMDTAAIAPGDNFVAAMEREIALAFAMLVLIGPRWLEIRPGDERPRLFAPGDHVRFEIRAGLERGLEMIPVLFQGAQMPRAGGQLPRGTAGLATKNAIEVRHSSFDADFERLAAELKKLEKKRLAASGRAPITIVNSA